MVILQILLLSTFLSTFSPATLVVVALKDGELYKFISVSDGNVLSVSGSGDTLSLEPWQDTLSQKWLAVEAINASDSFLLIPQKQSWSWDTFVKDSSTNRKDHLPDNTMVAGFEEGSGADSSNGKLIVGSYNGKKNQQWKSSSLGNDKVQLKNLLDEKCLMNVGELKGKSQGLFNKIKNEVGSALPVQIGKDSKNQPEVKVKPLGFFNKVKDKAGLLLKNKKDSKERPKISSLELQGCNTSSADKNTWRIEVLSPSEPPA